MNELEQDDPRLVSYIREHLIGALPADGLEFTPPKFKVSFNGEDHAYPNLGGQYGQPVFVEK